MASSYGPPSGPFRVHVPRGFHGHKRRILYIGKATKGEFSEENAAELYFNGNSPFWNFARSISKLADHNCEDLSNLAWSNIFKQGVTKGNPSGSHAESQRVAATQALRDEVIELKPTIIVLVNAAYYEEIVKAAFDIDDGSETIKGLSQTTVEDVDKFDLWNRPQFGDIPPIVWMYHPQGKKQAYLDEALKLIARVGGWT